MANLLLVGIGGFVGSVFRYLVSGWAQEWSGSSTFPFGTLTVNVAGCLLIGFLGGLVETRQLFDAELRLFLLIGVLGGFTTFSTFGYETLTLLRDAQYIAAGANVVLQVISGIGAAFLGFIISRNL